jgi:N-carbamoylputrescine amidase
MNTSKGTVRLAVVQTNCGPDLKSNIAATLSQIESVANDGAQIVCLQELFASQYFCQTENHDHFELAESIPGPLTQQIGQLASDLKIVIVSSHFERRAAGLFHNTAVTTNSDGEMVGKYRKMHIPDDPSFEEKFYFTPGDLGFQTASTSFADLGVCVCWDQWFPEAARLTALSGSQILIYPTAIGWLADEKDAYGESQLDAWRTMMRSHAIANGVFVVAANRVGIEDKIEFWGSSFVCDPYGNVIAQAGQDQQNLMVDCDLSLIETARTWWPFLRDRRIDAYGGLTRRMLD